MKTSFPFFNTRKKLNNGLNDEENNRLFETRNIKEMVYLLFKGLSEIR